MKQRPAQQRRRRQKTSESPTRRVQESVLSRFNAHAAGIDVGASSHWVAVPADRDEQPVRCFGTFTADLYALALWLEQCAIQTLDPPDESRLHANPAVGERSVGGHELQRRDFEGAERERRHCP